MLFYNRISESEGINANHTGLDTSKECNVCYFHFLKDRNFLYQTLVCNGCHDVSWCAIHSWILKLFQLKTKPVELLAIWTKLEQIKVFKVNNSSFSLLFIRSMCGFEPHTLNGGWVLYHLTMKITIPEI